MGSPRVSTRSLITALGITLNMSTLLAQDPEREVMALQTPEQIVAYWESMLQADQTHRALHTVDSIDNVNFKKMVLLIKHHGFPVRNITPSVIFTHQRSAYVSERYFPLFLDAFEAGLADTIWFLHNVRALHRARFADDLLQPDVTNYRQVLQRLDPFIPDTPGYDLAPFDSLFSVYTSEVWRIISSPPIRQWANSENDHISWYQMDDGLYTHTMWNDSSYAMPQRITFDASSSIARFQYDIPGRYLKLLEDGTLVVFKEDKERMRFYPVK